MHNNIHVLYWTDRSTHLTACVFTASRKETRKIWRWIPHCSHKFSHLRQTGSSRCDAQSRRNQSGSSESVYRQLPDERQSDPQWETHHRTLWSSRWPSEHCSPKSAQQYRNKSLMASALVYNDLLQTKTPTLRSCSAPVLVAYWHRPACILSQLHPSGTHTLLTSDCASVTIFKQNLKTH